MDFIFYERDVLVLKVQDSQGRKQVSARWHSTDKIMLIASALYYDNDLLTINYSKSKSFSWYLWSKTQ